MTDKNADQNYENHPDKHVRTFEEDEDDDFYDYEDEFTEDTEDPEDTEDNSTTNDYQQHANKKISLNAKKPYHSVNKHHLNRFYHQPSTHHNHNHHHHHHQHHHRKPSSRNQPQPEQQAATIGKRSVRAVVHSPAAAKAGNHMYMTQTKSSSAKSQFPPPVLTSTLQLKPQAADNYILVAVVVVVVVNYIQKLKLFFPCQIQLIY